MRSSWLFVLGMSALSMVGCAPMSAGAPVVTDTPRGSFERSFPTGASEVAVQQTGVDLELQLTGHCNVVRVDRIERTTIREHHNDAPQNDWWAGIGGAVLAGAGALAVADPQRVQPKDGNTSLDEVRGGGYALIGLGAALLAVPVIDYVRVHREVDHKVERVEEPGPMVRRDAPCGPPAEGTEVRGRYPGDAWVSLGHSDSRGRIRVSLDAVTPVDLAFRRDASLSLFGPNGQLGEAPLAALYDRREDGAWRVAASNDCSASLEERGCVAQEHYLAAFSAGPHAAEVSAVVDGARARRRVAADAAAWAAVDLAACRAPRAAWAEIDTACAPVARYLRDYPEGTQARLASEVIGAANVRMGQLEAAESRREAAATAVAQAAEASADAPSGPFIAYAGNGGGPTQCSDGSVSHSSGRGTCSHHGGIAGGSSRSTGGTRGGGGRRSSGGGGRRGRR